MQIVVSKLSAMAIVMMKLILLTAIMMVVTVVQLVVSTQNIVQNVYVMKEANQWLTFHVSDLIYWWCQPQTHNYLHSVSIGCHTPMELIGNRVCNDEAKNEDCNYDGGDCKWFFMMRQKTIIIVYYNHRLWNSRLDWRWILWWWN